MRLPHAATQWGRPKAVDKICRSVESGLRFSARSLAGGWQHRPPPLLACSERISTDGFRFGPPILRRDMLRFA
jgi:hypothetical protein